MIAIGPVGETCLAHKSVPDIETNVRPILSDIATLGWLMVRDIQYLQKFAAAAAAASTANPAVPAARCPLHSLPFSTILTRLTRHPLSISFPNRSFGLYRFLLFHIPWPECMTRNPESVKTYSGKFSVIPNRTISETEKRKTTMNERRNLETSNYTLSPKSHICSSSFYRHCSSIIMQLK